MASPLILVPGCFNDLNSLVPRNRVTLMWMPGHETIEETVMADLLAKEDLN